MPTQKKNQQPENSQPGDPLFNLHHAEAEAELARQNPAALTTNGLSATNAPADDADDADDTTSDLSVGPLDSQGQRRGEPLNIPGAGSTAGHH